MYPSKEQVYQLAGTGLYGRIPVCRELYADSYTPVDVLRILRTVGRQCFLLESAEQNQKWGRYSILGYDPSMKITCKAGIMKIRRRDQEDTRVQETRNPGAVIQKLLEEYKSPGIQGMPPFTGGLVGYFSYEYFQYREPVLAVPEERDFPDLDLMMVTKALVFDHFRQKLFLITGVKTDALETSWLQAEKELAEMEALLNKGIRASFPRLIRKSGWKPAYTKEQYIRMVEKAKAYIREGEIFQVVLSNPQTALASGSLLDVYRVLRTTNPSPYMFYFINEDLEMAGASPETLVRLENQTISTFPLAGTRPRGKTEEEDRNLEQELLRDEKELAEHSMLVDLGRNDLGSICELGSIRIDRYCTVEKFSCVMHLGSQVSGRLPENRTGIDGIQAVLPAGTLSGAPKIRACQIIRELEKRPRGVYGGAVGYLDFTGTMDTCIGIRLVYKKDGRLCIQSGAGIVADSVPENEYQECRNKARALLNAVAEAEAGEGLS